MMTAPAWLLFAVGALATACGGAPTGTAPASPSSEGGTDAAGPDAADDAGSDAESSAPSAEIFAFQAPSPTAPFGPCNQIAFPIDMAIEPPNWEAGTSYLSYNWLQAPSGEGWYAFRNVGAKGTSGASQPAFCPAMSCTVDDANGIRWQNMGSMAALDNKNQATATHQMCRDDFSNYVLPHLNGVIEQLSWISVDQGVTAPDFSNWATWDDVITNELADPNWPVGAKVSTLVGAISFGRSGPNTFTPAYVFLQSYADASAPDWSASGMFESGVYLVNQSIRPADGSGDYFHETLPACSPGSSRPAWVLGGTTSDGTCRWMDDGAHAYPQESTSGQWAGTPNLQAKGPGVYNIDSGGMSAADLASGFPVTWETPYLVAQRNFDSAAVAHLDARWGASRVAYVRFGLGDGDEANVFNLPQFELIGSGLPYDDLKTVWTTYAKSMYAYWASLESTIPMVASIASGPNASTTTESPDWADAEADALAATLKVVGNQGIMSTDANAWTDQARAYPWTSGKACAGDWCNVLDHYGSTLSRFTFQSVAPTDPTGGGSPGPLTAILPFVSSQAASQQRIVYEMFCQGEDGFTAYDPNYSTYAKYSAGYQAALATFVRR